MSSSSLLLSPDTTSSLQAGAGMVEFSIIALPLLMLGLGSVEVSHWFYTRQALSLALLDAGRAAITDHNRAARIITTFEASLRPLYAAPRPSDTTQRLRHALSSRQSRMQGTPWQIEVLSPSASVYADFSDTGLHIDGASGRPAINNHYLAEQDDRNRRKGWSDGQGPISGQTIYEANTVVLRLSWLHQPRLPIMRPLLRALGNPHGNYRQRGLAQSYLPMTRQITLLMQSHPVHWSDDPSGKVIYHAENDVGNLQCPTWLCEKNSDTPLTTFDGLVPGSTDSSTPSTSDPTPSDNGTSTASAGSSDSGDAASEVTTPAVDPDDPACGVMLCCV